MTQNTGKRRGHWEPPPLVRRYDFAADAREESLHLARLLFRTQQEFAPRGGSPAVRVSAVVATTANDRGRGPTWVPYHSVVSHE